jgi:hypothetical protein
VAAVVVELEVLQMGTRGLSFVEKQYHSSAAVAARYSQAALEEPFQALSLVQRRKIQSYDGDPKIVASPASVRSTTVSIIEF